MDPGIRCTVALLRAHGFDTTDSGDGVSKIGGELDHDNEVMRVPHVFMRVQSATMIEESHRLAGLVRERFMWPTTATVEVTYSPVDGVAVLMLMGADDSMLKEVA